MQLHFPKPLHGWREFAGEVGVIVLGVLIALAAQQVAQSFQWRGDVADLRASIRAEMNRNLFTYPVRTKQKTCINARLDELQRWLEGWRAGRPQRLIGPIGIPISLVIRTSAWDGRDPATLSHMPIAEKLEYGFLYSEFANNEVHRLDERAAWIELASFNGATDLNQDHMMRLQGLIFRARLRDKRIDQNAVRFIKRAAESGLVPTKERGVLNYEDELCRPILPPPAPAVARQ